MPTLNNEHGTTTSDELTMPEIRITSLTLHREDLPQIDLTSFIESQRNIDLLMREFERESLARMSEESQRRQQRVFEEFQRSLVSNAPISRQFTDSISRQLTDSRNNFFDNRSHQASAPSTNGRPQQTKNEQRLQNYITTLKELLSETEMAKENERIESKLTPFSTFHGFTKSSN